LRRPSTPSGSGEAVLLVTRGGSPWMNLALEEALAVKAGEWGVAAARVWLQGPAVVVGYSLGLCSEVDCGLALRLGVPVVRRFTGGGAVYHDWGNLNLALAFPERLGVDALLGRGTGAMLRALRLLGVEARVENEGDVAVEGCKVSGSAAGVKLRSSLYHATLLVDVDSRLVTRLTPGRPERVERGEVTPVKYRPCSLRELGYNVSLAGAAEALAAAAEEALGPLRPPTPRELGELLGLARELCREKYSTGRYTLQPGEASCVEPATLESPRQLNVEAADEEYGGVRSPGAGRGR